MSRRFNSTNPIIVEVRPDSVPSIAPSTPPTPKAVRFANNTSDLVTGVTRPLNVEEAWALYHFESHARQCATCSNPQAVLRRGERLCEYGNDLAKGVLQYVYHYKGLFYSSQTQVEGKPVSVEILPEYDNVRGLLIAKDPAFRVQSSSSSSARPKVVHHTTYPQPSSPRPERRTSSAGSDSRRPEIILEPGNSAASRRRSVHRPRYATVVVGEKSERAATPSSSQERRGTLYDKDVQRKKESYRVEIREPDERKKERRQRVDDRWQ